MWLYAVGGLYKFGRFAGRGSSVRESRGCVRRRDSLTPKGFTVVTLQLDTGGEIDVFNLHLDAGSDDGDSNAGTLNVNQVAKAIVDRSNSASRAVIVMGDTNSRYTQPKDNLAFFLSQAKLTDTWDELARGRKAPVSTDSTLLCTVPIPTTTNCEVVDKVFYKSGKNVTLRTSDWKYLGKEFTVASGNPLADHTPISVKFAYSSA